jgi:ATP-dependent Clp protease adaptor protein ClpS
LGTPRSAADTFRDVTGPAYDQLEMASPTAPVIVPGTDEETDVDKPWQVIVWNDPVNTMGYVVYVFRKLFGYDEPKATELMLKVHYEGRAIVSDGPREKAEIDCFRLHNHGLWATLEK